MSKHRRKTRREISWPKTITKVTSKVQPIVAAVVWVVRLVQEIATLTGHLC